MVKIFSKKLLCIIAVVFAMIAVLLVLVKLEEYEEAQMYGFYYPISDEEYLGIKKLEMLPADDEDYISISKQLEDLGEMIILSARDNSELPQELSAYISEKSFKCLRSEFSYDNREAIKNGTGYVKFDYVIWGAKHNSGKAVVDFGYYCLLNSKDTDENLAGVISNSENHPSKLYLSCENGEWVVSDVYIPL